MRSRVFISLLTAAVALTGLLAGPVVAVGGTAAACRGWTPQPPSPGTSSTLSDVAVLSPCSAWAVGFSPGHTLIERWNGKTWSIRTSPNVGDTENVLSGVAATSAGNAWAVGYYNDTTGGSKTLIEHWDGSGWAVQTSPNPGTTYTVLYDVAATSASNAWAVGIRLDGTEYRPVVEHWNGKAWRTQPSPDVGNNGGFNGVSATSSTNAWAVGSALGQPLIEHWNGTAWRVQAAPEPPAGLFIHQDDVAALSRTEAWAVGYLRNASGSHRETLIEHWNGHRWRIVSSPAVGTGANQLAAVAATSATNAWAVGHRGPSSQMKTLVERWNGSAWKTQPSPNFGTGANALVGVDASSSTDAWAVGFYLPTPTSDALPLAVHCC
jgi:hypothetical protein